MLSFTSFIKLIVYIFLLFGFHLAFSQSLDSLYHSYKKQTNEKKKVEALLAYGDELSQYNIDSALACGSMAINIGKKLRDTSVIGQGYILYGYSALAKADYKSALQSFLLAHDLFKKSNNKGKLAQCYTAIGIVYWYQGFTEKAVYYYKKNIAISLEIRDDNGLAASYGNLAIIFDENKDFENALLYYNNALIIFEKKNKMNEMAACLDNMSLVYKQQKDFRKALNFNKRSYKIRESIRDTLGMLASMENLGSIFIALEKYDDAISISQQVITIAQRLGSKEDLKFSYVNLKDAYEGKKDFPMANIILNKLMAIKDSLRNIDNANQMLELETKFKTKEKEIELSEIKLVQQLKEKENQEKLQKKNYFILILSVIGILILSVGFLLLKRFKEKQQIAEAINKKNEAIEAQKIMIDKAYQELSEKNKDITDSIKYAQKIQQAVLPSQKFILDELSKTKTEHFILFKPKDIVSGDFYWFHKTDKALFYVTADSTGHGVPGGFMSMLGINLLNEIVIERGVTNPGDILNRLREEIVRSLKTDDGYSKDGMDAVVCKIDFVTNQLEYAAANNPIYLVRNKELTILPAQKMPVGYSDNMLPFETKKLSINVSDSVYTITDGFADQFGGPKGKKYKYKQLKELLVSVSNEPIQKQLSILDQSFENWKGNLEQVDDVCIIGLKF